MDRQPLQQPRCHAALVVARDRMYLVGGRIKDEDSGAMNSVASILQYDPDTDEWIHVNDMVEPRHDVGCSAIGKTV